MDAIEHGAGVGHGILRCGTIKLNLCVRLDHILDTDRAGVPFLCSRKSLGLVLEDPIGDRRLSSPWLMLLNAHAGAFHAHGLDALNRVIDTSTAVALSI